jgi:diguanylate cyclase (GGDEF)-like protein
LDRFRQDFAALSFPFAGKSISATTSIGAAGYEGTDPPDLSELMSRADHALYASKRAGRNHVHVEVL